MQGPSDMETPWQGLKGTHIKASGPGATCPLRGTSGRGNCQCVNPSGAGSQCECLVPRSPASSCLSCIISVRWCTAHGALPPCLVLVADSSPRAQFSFVLSFSLLFPLRLTLRCSVVRESNRRRLDSHSAAGQAVWFPSR